MERNLNDEFQELGGVEYFNNNLDRFKKNGYFIPINWKFSEQMFYSLKNLLSYESTQTEIEQGILEQIFVRSDSYVVDNYDYECRVDKRIIMWGFDWFPRYLNWGGNIKGITSKQMDKMVDKYESEVMS